MSRQFASVAVIRCVRTTKAARSLSWVRYTPHAATHRVGAPGTQQRSVHRQCRSCSGHSSDVKPNGSQETQTLNARAYERRLSPVVFVSHSARDSLCHRASSDIPTPISCDDHRAHAACHAGGFSVHYPLEDRCSFCIITNGGSFDKMTRG